MTTNYRATFITISPDSCVTRANREPRLGTVAALQLRLLQDAPYTLTSDDLLFEVHAMRTAIVAHDRLQGRTAFESRPQACLRASPLVKSHGWGLHHDRDGRVRAIAVDDPAYAVFAADISLNVVPGMRSSRKAKD